MTKGCRRCVTVTVTAAAADDEVRRLARLMARTTSPSKLSGYRDQLAIAKANRTELMRWRDHECDNLLIDDHWAKGSS